jgi:allantoicase
VIKNLPQMTDLETYVDLASHPTSTILFATDDFFAVAENLLVPKEPHFDPTTYTPQGKEMDGWETRRKRIPGHDFVILKVLRGRVVGLVLDTAFFTGNHVPAVSVQVWDGPLELPPRTSIRGSCAPPSLVHQVDEETRGWKYLIPTTPLHPGYPETRKTVVRIQESEPVTYIRLNAFPDGGIARLHVYGIVEAPQRGSGWVDIACLDVGGRALQWSNAHYGTPMRLLAPGRSTGMHDGWETARNPNRPPIFTQDEKGELNVKGFDWAILKMGMVEHVKKIVVDTNHYKGNFPESVVLLYSDQDPSTPVESLTWKVLLPRQKLGPHQEHVFETLAEHDRVSFIKVEMIPDGGISRLRVFAYLE